MSETNETNQLLKELIKEVKDNTLSNKELAWAIGNLASSNRQLVDALISDEEDEDEQEQPTYLNSRD